MTIMTIVDTKEGRKHFIRMPTIHLPDRISYIVTSLNMMGTAETGPRTPEPGPRGRSRAKTLLRPDRQTLLKTLPLLLLGQ